MPYRKITDIKAICCIAKALVKTVKMKNNLENSVGKALFELVTVFSQIKAEEEENEADKK